MLLFSHASKGFSIHHTVDERPNDFNFQMHAHSECELYYFISGKGYYTVEGNNYPLSPGTIMVMREGETHKLHISDVMPYERITIHFSSKELMLDDKVINRIFYERQLGKQNIVECPDSSKRFIFSCLSRLCALKGAPTREEILAYLLPVVYEISKFHYSSLPEKDAPAKTDSELVVAIITYINEHLGEIKNLDEIEQNFYFSRSYLNRIFKKKTGSTIWNYIILKRLLNAQNDIKAGKSAAVAAAMNGFGDYSSFYRQYKSQFGTSPILDRSTTSQKQ